MSGPRRKKRKQPLPFDLTANPFYILGVSPGATAYEISLAHQTALRENVRSEDEVHRAQHLLMESRSRLEAEISWLSGTAIELVGPLIESLTGPKRQRGVPRDLSLLKGPDRANFCADLCYRGGYHGPTVSGQNLAFAYFDFDEETVAKIVASNRARAGLPKPSLAMLNDALMDLRSEHVKAALHCYGGKGHTDLNYHLVEWAKSFDLVRKGRFFMEDVVRQYVVSEEPQLSRLKDSLFRAVARLSENANASTVLEEIKYVLFSWRLLMEPLQRLEAAKGRDEPRSLELYHQLQKLYTELFDEGLRRELALTLARVAQSRFMFLPAASEEIDEAVRSMEIAAQTTK